MANRVKQFYAEAGGGNMFDSRYLTPELNDFLRDEAIVLENVVLGNSYNHIIEVGCGYGRYLKWAVSRDLDYDGIDLVPWLVDLGKPRVEQARRANPHVHCDIYNISAEFLAATLYEHRPQKPGRRTLVFFPFNCFGNLDKVTETLDSLQRTGTDVLISTFQNSSDATSVRMAYYAKCGYTNQVSEVDQLGVVVTSDEGLKSYAYDSNYLVSLLGEYGYEPAVIRPFSRIGRSLYFRWTPVGSVTQNVSVNRDRRGFRTSGPTPRLERPLAGHIQAVSEAERSDFGTESPLASAELLSMESSEVTVKGLSLDLVTVQAKKSISSGSLVRVCVETEQEAVEEHISMVAMVCRTEEVSSGWWTMVMRILTVAPVSKRRLHGILSRVG